jgi:predicted nucleic acid-binding protein
MLFLLDKSAHELARRDLAARRAFETMAITGVLATCAIVELEVLYSARNPADHRRLKKYLREQCIWLETSDSTLSAAVDLQEAMLSAGMHRKPIPDLVIASVAREHDAVLVHHGRDFDDIATVATDLRSQWIIPPPQPERSPRSPSAAPQPPGDLGRSYRARAVRSG